MSFSTAQVVTAFFKASAFSNFSLMPCSSMSRSASLFSERISVSAARAAASEVTPLDFFVAAIFTHLLLVKMHASLVRHHRVDAIAAVLVQRVLVITEPLPERLR